MDSLEAVKRMNAECVEGIQVLSLRRISDEKKMTGMTILSAADYLVSLKNGSLPDDWKKKFEDFMSAQEIRVMKQTKRSEREVDIRPQIFQWAFQGDDIYLQLAAGSSVNLKPELVMDTFLSRCGIPEDTAVFACHRLEMYAYRKSEEDKKTLVTLESLGEEMVLGKEY